MLLIRPLKPGKCLLAIVESQVSVHKGGRRNITSLLAPFQFSKKPKCVRASPGVGIRSDQHTNNGWSTVCNRDRLFENRDRFVGLTLGDKNESKSPESSFFVRLDGQYSVQLLNGLIVAAGVKQNPRNGRAGNCEWVVLMGTLRPSHCLLRT